MKAWQCGFAFKNSRQWNFTSSVTNFCFPSAHVWTYCGLLHFVFKNPLWGGAPSLSRCWWAVTIQAENWSWIGLTKARLCVLWQTVATDNAPGRAVCMLETLSWGFSKTPTMCWRALAVVLGVHTRASSWMCWRMEGWKSALWGASSTCLTIVSCWSFPQGGERWWHLATMDISTRDNPALTFESRGLVWGCCSQCTPAIPGTV